MIALGSSVYVEFSSADATTAAAVTLKDADGNTVTLKASERLVLWELTLAAATAAGVVTLFDDIDGGGTVSARERIVEWQDGNVRFGGGPEGRACSIGGLPKVKAAVAGQVSVNGVGAIVMGKSASTRPSWRESMT